MSLTEAIRNNSPKVIANVAVSVALGLLGLTVGAGLMRWSLAPAEHMSEQVDRIEVRLGRVEKLTTTVVEDITAVEDAADEATDDAAGDTK